MLAEIITIGDEILIGQIVDTNSAWIAQRLNDIGIQVNRITSIADTHEEILKALGEAEQRVDLVLTTGGLGPTKDDITKRALCDFFETEMEYRPEILEDVEIHFTSRGIKMPVVNKEQAELPKSCETIRNTVGTAPGMLFERNNKLFASMPGVPYEMKNLMESALLERFRTYFKTPVILHRTVLTQGVGESTLMEMVTDWEDSLSLEDIKLAYLPSAGNVRLRLSTIGESRVVLEEKIARKVAELSVLIPDFIFGFETDKLEAVVGSLLIENKQTVATAESCTGGYIAHLLTSIAGSSAYFEGSVVSYSNGVKQSALGVTAASLEKHGAVSQQVVEEMAQGARKELKTDFALATSGVAGPTGGTPEKPVGTVWIAVASERGVHSKLFAMGNSRERNIRKSALAGLDMLRKEIQATNHN